MAGGKWLPAALLTGVLLGAAALTPRAKAAMLTPNPSSVVAGNSVILTLDDTIPMGSGVGAIDLTVSFDPSILTLTAVDNRTLIPGWLPTNNLNDGLISIRECDSCDDAEGTGSVLALTFFVAGTAPTMVTSVTVQTTSGRAGIAGEYTVGPTSASIGITASGNSTPVPEPASIALLLAPMLAAASLKRRDRG